MRRAICVTCRASWCVSARPIRPSSRQLCGVIAFLIHLLIGRKQAAVGNARALVLHMDDAAHTRLERRAHAVEQVRQCAIVRRFLDD